MTDQELADKIRLAIRAITTLMNEAKSHNIVVEFNIPTTQDMTTNPPTERFLEIVTIRKIETL